jgi:hypothetical protein
MPLEPAVTRRPDGHGDAVWLRLRPAAFDARALVTRRTAALEALFRGRLAAPRR